MPALTSSTMLSCAAAGRGAVTSHAIDSDLSASRVRDRWGFRERRIRIEPFLSPIALVNASRIHLTVIVPACQWGGPTTQPPSAIAESLSLKCNTLRTGAAFAADLPV